MRQSSGGRREAPRESFAERRDRRAAIEDPAVVLEAGLRFLEARARSMGEVRRRLTTAGYREDLVTGAIDRLSELGMLDDEAFAAQWVESRDRANPRGEHALMLELRRKGIDATVIAATLRARREAATRWRGTDADGDLGDAPLTPDESAARKLLQRHGRVLARIVDPRQRRQRAYALLARNGFSPDVAGALARAAAESEDAEPDVDRET